jgi:hypothetical protein
MRHDIAAAIASFFMALFRHVVEGWWACRLLTGARDDDIPDAITASNYLPLSGGSIAGDLALSGTLTANALAVAGITSSGALIGPYVQATSSAATSTFAGGLTIDGRVSIGTSSPAYTFHLVGTQPASDTDIGLVPYDNTDKSTLRVFNVAGYQTQISTFASGSGTWNGIPAGDLSVYYADGRNVALWNAGIGSTFFGTGGVVRQTITGSGNIGVGTTSPWARLSVTNTGSGPSFLVEDQSSPDDSPFVIDASGNVGIGNTSPSNKLDVAGFINTDQYSGLKQAGNTILYASSTNFTTLVGKDAGRLLTSAANYSTATARFSPTRAASRTRLLVPTP